MTDRLTIEYVPHDNISTHPANARQGDVGAIHTSITTNGVYRPVVVQRSTGHILAGNHTYLAMLDAGMAEIPVVYRDVDDVAAKKLMLADNRTADLGTYDDTALAALMQDLDLHGTGWDGDDLDELLTNIDAGPLDLTEAPTLAERYGAPPMTVLSGRTGEWVARKREWLGTGLASGTGRDDNLVFESISAGDPDYYNKKTAAEKKLGREMTSREFEREHGDDLKMMNAGTSVFDPVLTELLVRWFSTKGDHLIDPWAGGSVRGIVSAALGRTYHGIDLSQDQCDANDKQADLILPPLQADPDAPRWEQGDGTERLRALPDESADSLIGCPPYYDLENYGDDPRDLSNLSYAEFDQAMIATLIEVARVLRPNRFACFVVAAVRTKEGHLLDMRRLMVDGMKAGGMHLVNDAILATPVGSAAIRAQRSFNGTRTLARTHQEVLVFVKGDRKQATVRLDDVSDAVAIPEPDDVDE